MSTGFLNHFPLLPMLNISVKVLFGWIMGACDAGGQPLPQALSHRPQEREGNEVGRMIYVKHEVNNLL